MCITADRSIENGLGIFHPGGATQLKSEDKLYRPSGAKEIHAVKGKMDENLW